MSRRRHHAGKRHLTLAEVHPRVFLLGVSVPGISAGPQPGVDGGIVSDSGSRIIGDVGSLSGYVIRCSGVRGLAYAKDALST